LSDDSLTLEQAAELIHYGADCRICQDGIRRIDLHALIEKLGPDFKLGDVRPLLRCSRCGQKRVIVSMPRKDATTTQRQIERWK
jgi:hypothetical protein